jgi:outer membrane protein
MYSNKISLKFTLISLSVVCLLFSTSSQSATAASSAPETIFQIFHLAVENDPTLSAASSIFNASKENTRYARGGLHPDIELVGELGRTREDVETDGVGTSGLTYFDHNKVLLRLEQPLYRKDIFTEIDIADAESQAAASEYKLAKQNLIMRLTEAYFDVLFAVDNKTFAQAEEQAIGKQLQNIKRRYKVGKSTITDLQEARASHDLAVAQVIIAQDDYEDSLEGLTQLTGLQHTNIAGLSPDFVPGKLEPANLAYWVKLAEDNNKKLQADRHTIQALKYEIDNRNSGHYPKLDLVAKYRLEESGGRFGNSETDDRSIMLRLDVPLYKGGQVSSKTRTASINLNEAKDRLRRTHRSVMRETRKSFRSVMSSLKRISALKKAVASAETALAMITKGYKVGTRTNVDVLDAQREVYKVHRDYSADKYKYTINYILLKNLTGTLSQNDLAFIDKWFAISGYSKQE